ncbi:DUF1289 domain-containing protein [Ottowia thiooxydans]|uniref:DUF1289 domain-containing protein n=1 Tax=Ottowia thiooxydans TaxID=219182 RepID=UPI001FE05B28|nr:DUF1289 domain-containing protein [Ottowia thiooxydans]
MRDLDAIALEAQLAHDDGTPLPSPCVRTCRIDEQTGWCEGCFRRLEEISGWSSKSESDKWGIWRQVQLRRGS